SFSTGHGRRGGPAGARRARNDPLRRVFSGVFAARSPSWFWDKGMSRPIRRILSWTAIHLGAPSPTRSSGLPAKDRVESLDAVRAGRPRTFAQSRERLLLTLLRVGFTEPPPSPAALVVRSEERRVGTEGRP